MPVFSPQAIESWRDDLIALQIQSKIHWNYPLKRFNTLKVGGNAACLINVLNHFDLSKILPFINRHKLSWFVLGKGSNLIVPDSGWPGIVLRLAGDFKYWKPDELVHQVKVGSGLADATFAQKCIPLGWTGLEFLIGIPGSIGGAIAMNAGAHGGEVSDFLSKVWWMDMDGNHHEAKGESLDFAYRYSPLNGKNGTVITDALFQLKRSNSEMVRANVEKYQKFRFEKQPQNLPNCGSVFKNPPQGYAGRLIESVGLKGYRIGNAQISEKHSNFIVNLGDASAQDIIDLMTLAQKKVREAYQIELVSEVQVLSF